MVKAAFLASVLVCVFAVALCAQAPVTPYGLALETRPGLVIITFTAQGGQARAFLPDDAAAGEPISGAMESTRVYVFDFGGQIARTDDDFYHWTVPVAPVGGFVPLILRDRKGTELARASVPVASSGGIRPPAFRFPKFIQAGSAAPLFGPFDGDARTTAVTVGAATAGEPHLRILAESTRKVVVRAPEQVSGPIALSIKEGSVEETATVRSLIVEHRTLKSSLSAGEMASLDVSIRGLTGLDVNVPLKLENRSPGLVSVYDGDSIFPTNLAYMMCKRMAASRSAAHWKE